MKKNFSLIIAVFLLSSCSDFLTENPTTSLQTGLYDTEEALESQIYGILGRFYGSTMYTGEGFEFLNLSGTLLHHGLESTATRNTYYTSLLEYTEYSTSSKNQNFFRGLFNVVNACNVLIAALPSSPVDEQFKKEIEAEARFYRAYTYFRIVRTWGDAPIRKETITSENVNAKRDPYYKVYGFIVEDLDFAAENMRTPERVDAISPNKSRAHKYAATALLSSVYCTIGSLLTSQDDNFWNNSKTERKPDFSAIHISNSQDAYRLALKNAELLIKESPTFDSRCQYSLVENFADLFNWDSYTSPEIYNLPERIFVLPITKSFGKTNVTLPEYSLPPYAEGTEYRDDLVATGRGRWRVDRWTYQHWCEDYPGTKGTGKASNVYDDSADPRFNLTLYHTKIYNEQTKSYSLIYPHPDKILSNASKLITYPFLRKYWSKRYSADSGEADLYLMRLAEVYLNAVEAAGELGENGKAEQYMEVLHARARKSVSEGQPEAEMPKWQPGQHTGNIDDFRTQIFWERIYEYVGEMHEFDEMHRHGATWLVKNLSEPMNAFLKLPEQAKLYTTGYFYPRSDQPYEYVTDVETARKGLLWDYPQSEINYNDSLTQADQNDYTYGL